MYSFGSEHIKGSLFLIFHNFFQEWQPWWRHRSLPFNLHSLLLSPMHLSLHLPNEKRKQQIKKKIISEKNIFSKYNMSVSYKIFAIFHIRIFSLKSAWTVLLAAFWTKTLFALCVTLSFIQNINTFVEYILEIVFWVRLTSNKNEILEEMKCAQLS